MKLKKIVHILIIFSGLLLVLWSLFKKDIKSADDLTDIKCIVDGFSFKETKPGRFHTYQYFIYPQNYACDFRISPNSALYFQIDLFADSVKKGDTIDVAVPKNMLDEINKLGNVDIYSAKYKNIIFLLSDNSIRESSKANNFFIFAGIVMIAYTGWWFISR